MPQPDPAACCPDAYYCPTAAETECPRHGGLTACCARTGLHVPMDREAWNLAQEGMEQRWLSRFVRARDLYRGKDCELPPFWEDASDVDSSVKL